MKYVVATTRDDAQELKRIYRKLARIPADGLKGVHVGGGIHANQDAPGFPGRTRDIVDYRKHPTLQQWAVPVTDAGKALWQARKSELTQDERDFVIALLVSEQDLDSTWDVPAA